MPNSHRVGTGVAVGTAAALLFAPLIATPAFAAPSESVVINEVYVDGGFAGAAYANKFVELRNLGSETVDLDTWSLQYRASGNANPPAQRWPLSGTIEPGGTYLIQGQAPASPAGAALPTPDLVTAFNGSGTAGTVVLASTTGAVDIGVEDVATRSVEGLVDLVGYRTDTSGSNIWEGELADATATGVTASLQRVGADTDVNATDFATAAPTPTNAAGETAAPTIPDPVDPDPADPDPADPDPADPAITPIAGIQGTGQTSPITGQTVTTEGVVIGSFLNDSDEAGLHIQTAGTGGAAGEASHGVFVQWPEGQQPDTAALEVGDALRVTGTVREHYGVTKVQLSEPASQVVDLGAAELPTATPLEAPIDSVAYERLESMLVQLEGEFTVSDVYEANRYGEISLTPGTEPLLNPTTAGAVGSAEHAAATAALADVLLLDDGRGYNFTTNAEAKALTLPYLDREVPPTVGAAAEVIAPAVLGYAFNTWRLQPSTGDEVPVEFERTRESAPQDVGGELQLATFNVLNFFSTTGDEIAECTSYYTDRDGNPITANQCDVRGAADQENLDRQSAKIVAAIRGLGAEVIALEEVENSEHFLGQDRDAAVAELVDLLNAAEGGEAWAYAASPAERPALAEQDVIRNAFIYRADAVETVGGSEMLVGDENFSNAREPLAQVFRPLGGGAEEEFLVISNHFKSKSASGAAGDNVDEGQGAWNADRTRQAQSLVAFSERIAEERGVERVFLVGDFNSYAKEDPIAVIEAAGFADVSAGTGEYTYQFGGGVGSLDYVFANEAAAASISGTDIWNINSTESVAFEYSRYNSTASQLYAPDVYRSSDHDPILVGLDLSEAADTTTIQVLGINDFHGRILESGQIAGAATLAGAVEHYREQNENTLFLSAGDNIGASIFESLLQQDNPTIDALVAAGLDVSAVGNHEFDAGWSDLRDRVIPRFAEQSGLTIEEAGRFALGANVYLAGTETPALDEYFVQELDGVRVGVIATLVEEMDQLVSANGITDLDFGSQVEAANRVAAQLSDGEESNGEAEVIVLVSHDGSTATSCEAIAAEETVFGELVRTASPQIDAIISGHTHTAYDCAFPVAGSAVDRPVIQAGGYTELLDRLVFEVDAEGEVVASSSELVDLIGGPIAFQPDAEVAALVAEATAEAAVLGQVPVGEISADILRAGTPPGADRTAESSASNFVADVQLWATSRNPGYTSTPSQIAFMNPGGVRDDLLYAGDPTGGASNIDGVVTYREAYSMQPFGNTLVTMDMTGAQIVQALEEQITPERSLHLGVSANVDYEYDREAPAGQRVGSLEIDGASVADDQVVRVTVNSFLSTGSGDGFTAFGLGENRRDSALVDMAVTLSYFEQVAEACGVVDPPAIDRARLPGTDPVRGEVLEIVDECSEEPGSGEPGTPVQPGPGQPGTPGAPGLPGTGEPKPSWSPVAAAVSALIAAFEDVITSDDRSLSAGETIRVFVGVQYAAQWVQVWLHSEPVLLGGGWLQVAADGYVTVELPDELPAGAHRLVVLDAEGNVIGWQSVSVADTGVAALPDTGVQGVPVLVLASVLLAAGLVLVVARRRAARQA